MGSFFDFINRSFKINLSIQQKYYFTGNFFNKTHNMRRDQNGFTCIFGIGNQFTDSGIGLLDDIIISDEVKKKIQSRELVRFETVFDFSRFNLNNTKNVGKNGKTGKCHLDFQISPFGFGRREAALGFLVHVQDITARKTAEEMLRKAHDHLEEEVRRRTAHLHETNQALEILLNERKNRTAALNEKNTALKVLLNERQEERRSFREAMLHSLEEGALPFLHQLKTSGLTEEQLKLAEVLESALQDAMDPIIRERPLDKLPLTRTELQVARLIQKQYSSAEIAKIFDTSLRTIEQHRYNLRKKLGLTNKKQNLRSFLLLMNQRDGESEFGVKSE